MAQWVWCCTIWGLMMSFLGVHPRKDIINPRVVQSSYPLTSHGTTITCGLSCGVLREAPGEGMSVLCCTLKRVPGVGLFVYMLSVSWCTSDRLQGMACQYSLSRVWGKSNNNQQLTTIQEFIQNILVPTFPPPPPLIYSPCIAIQLPSYFNRFYSL